MEQTRDGELSKRLREVIQRLAPTFGFRIKVVERAGMSLRNKFPQANLWEEAKCGRSKFTTCNQEGEPLPPCTKKSMVYDNICNLFNEGARGKEEVIGGSNPIVPSIYIGESSRTIFERAWEHCGAPRGSLSARSRSHMAKHQEMVLGGEPPEFTMRVVRFHKGATN